MAYTAGAAIGPDLFRFYRSIGVNLKQLYGPTETCAYVCLQPDGGVKFDTRGLAGAGRRNAGSPTTAKCWCVAPMLLKEYYKRPDATAESIDADGYFHTGDAGLFDERRPPEDHRPREGRRQADRRRDVRAATTSRTSSSSSRYIKEAVAFGDERDKVCAFINIDIGAVGNWAERRGLPIPATPTSPAKPEVYELIQECVEKVNAELAAEARLAGSQIRRFLVLHKELDPDDDELTRTRKVRRGFVAEKYAVLIDALYCGQGRRSTSRRR